MAERLLSLLEYQGISRIFVFRRMRRPSFLIVLTAIGPYAYRREDGVYVVPVTCLKD